MSTRTISSMRNENYLVGILGSVSRDILSQKATSPAPTQ